ncbi:UvrD-helicase domain-containing protein [Pelagibaculum spongiae]|uniref:DNA 3'-5' helicase n=1 Tax=Pelagibaculum spongiae TaxID=2080658 RepID=A0A2V1GP42_9GAMM|nr:UvrD-helicase domain-containing protein [Pelagibaculum spongiae]PVZ64474.1 DNA helicase [Pelagibaculum spongiae]
MTAVEMPKVAIAADFLSAFAKIPKKQQKKVQEFISKFRQNPTSSAINYEKIIQARSKDVFSVRIDYAYRGIVLKPKQGNIFMLMWVDHHDEAYGWAERHECVIHRSTGAIQIVDVSYQQASETPPPQHIEPEQIAKPQPVVAAEVTPLFADYSCEQILALGVPDAFIDTVMSLTSDRELDKLEYRLPPESYEPLFFLAAGDSYDELLNQYNQSTDEAVDTEDYAAALERAVSQRSFKLVTDDLDLQKMLNAPLEKWRVFLHPSQRNLVNKSNKGPTRVLGGAGTGKTVVAMHRAVALAKAIPNASGSKVLFTTFTRNLALDIEHSLKKIASEAELAKIEVVNIDSWVSRFLSRCNYDFKVVYDQDQIRKQCWKIALDQAPVELNLEDQFYREEWHHVVQQNDVQSRQEYFKISRVGRGTPLTRIERAKIWPVFEEYRNQMNRKRIREVADAMMDAIKLLRERDLSLPYSSVIVDEAQDMGRQAFTLLRALIPEKANDMFIVGDGHQRIYRNKVVLSHCGINVRGRRSQKLKINYRTTEETRRFASSILNNVEVDNLDGEADQSHDYLSLFHGEQPLVKLFSTGGEEVTFVQQTIQQLLQQEDIELKDICMVARTKYIRNSYAKQLNDLGIETYSLSGQNADSNKSGLRVATMHRVKGLEFKYLFIINVSDGVIPLCNGNSNDPVEQRDNDFNERALLHVSATRAIKGLFVTATGTPSTYLASFL